MVEIKTIEELDSLRNNIYKSYCEKYPCNREKFNINHYREHERQELEKHGITLEIVREIIGQKPRKKELEKKLV